MKLKLFIKNNIINSLFVFSLIVFSVIMNLGNKYYYILISTIVSLIVGVIILKKDGFKTCLESKNKSINVLSIIIAIFCSKHIMLLESSNIEALQGMISSIIGIDGGARFIKLGLLLGAYVCIFVVIYFIANYMISKFGKTILKFFKSFDKSEKRFIIIASILAIVFIGYVYSVTNLFYRPVYSNNGHIQDGWCDLVYTTDTGGLNIQNTYMNNRCGENDLRQPLFAIFAFPFGVIAKEIAELLFFIPNGYEFCMAIIQAILVLISTMCISRMLNISNNLKRYFRVCYIFMYSTLLFLLNMEQYIFATFWLVILLYNYYLGKKEAEDFLYISATSSLLTSGVAIVTMIGKDIKKSLKHIIQLFFKFLATIVVFGKLHIFTDAINTFLSLSRFTGKDIAFTDRFIQFTHYIKSCFVKPNTHIFEKNPNILSYMLKEPKTISIVGLILMIIILVCFILNRKEKSAKIFGTWSLFSVVILLIIGWGTAENGLILYSLYFGFSFLALIFMGINKLYNKFPKIINVTCIVLIICFAIFNIYGIADLLKFGIKYYSL